MGKVMLGTISYIPPDAERKAMRIANHRKQLEWLSTFLTPDDLYYRVESAWGHDSDYDTLYDVPFKINSIKVGPAYPGANRNVLLKKLYESDYDWLVIMDDDRALYPYFSGEQFFTHELTGPDGDKFAKNGVMIKALSPMVEPFKKQCVEFPQKKECWFISKSTPSGFLQIVCIPNLVKYGYQPVYMNGETSCLLGTPPEDVQFELDWLLAKHGLACNKNLVMKEFGGDKQSSIYVTREYRQQVEKYHKTWIDAYLKEKNPRIKELWTKKGLNARRNTFVANTPFHRVEVKWNDEWDDIVDKK